MSAIRLSVCMIVKNEEKFLSGCLESVGNIADQIVILDTGSTDNTVKIAEQYGAEIHTFDWCDDFAAARNASIAPAKGDWILWLDADERLTPESQAVLRREMTNENTPVIYQVQINNHTRDDARAYISTALRLFRNRQGIEFYGRIHEQVRFTRKKGQIRKSHIKLEHLGYALDEADDKLKKERNQQLLERMVVEEPNNAYAHFTLGQHYNLMRRYNDGLRHLKKALELNDFEKPMQAGLCNILSETYYKLNRTEQAAEMARQSLELEPDQVSAWYMLYQLARKQKKWDDALLYVENMERNSREIEKNGRTLPMDVIFDAYKLDMTRAEIYASAGMPGRAFEILADYINRGNKDSELWKRGLDFALLAERWDDAEQLATSLFRRDQSNLYMLDTLGKIYVKQRRYNEATQVFEALCAQAPHNAEFRKMLDRLNRHAPQSYH